MTVFSTLPDAPPTVDGDERIYTLLPSGGTPNRKRSLASLLTFFLSQSMRDKLSGLAGGASSATSADAYFLGRANHEGEQAIGTVTGLQDALDGKLGAALPASATPVDNGDITIERTSNTLLTLKLRGTDGTVRSTTLTLS